jgi:hypothetical protein
LSTGEGGVHLRTSKMTESKLIGPGGTYPFVLFAGNHILGAWESDRGITVERLE